MGISDIYNTRVLPESSSLRFCLHQMSDDPTRVGMPIAFDPERWGWVNSQVTKYQTLNADNPFQNEFKILLIHRIHKNTHR